MRLLATNRRRPTEESRSPQAAPYRPGTRMKLLVTAEIPREPTTINYSFRLGVKYWQKAGNFDAGGACRHVVAEEKGREIRLGCGVDCDGGG